MPAKFYINPQNLRGGGGISIFKFTAARGRERDKFGVTTGISAIN
jgi:hypothetical protein